MILDAVRLFLRRSTKNWPAPEDVEVFSTKILQFFSMIQFWAILAILVHLVHTAFVTVSMHPSFDLGLKQLDKSPIWSYAGKSQSMLLSCRRRNVEKCFLCETFVKS